MEKPSEMYYSIYKELREIIGEEATLKVYSHFKGQQVTFPVRLYSPDMIGRKVRAEFDGSNVRALAQKYDYSEKTIRRMVKTVTESSD